MVDTYSKDPDYDVVGRRSPGTNRRPIQLPGQVRSYTRGTHHDDRGMSQNGVLRDRTPSIIQSKQTTKPNIVAKSSPNLDINRGVDNKFGEKNNQLTEGRKPKPKQTTSKAKSSPKKTAKKPVKKIELNFLGNFTDSEWINATQEEKYQAAKKTDSWFPDRHDFEKAAAQGKRSNSKIEKVSTALDVMIKLAEIGKKNPGTVERVNIFAHGADSNGEAAMDGIVSHEGVDWPESQFPRAAFNHSLFDITSNPEQEIRPPDGEWLSVSEIKKAFAPGATVYMYACHAGLTQEYLEKLSDAFGVPVKGFSQSVRYGFVKDEKGKITEKFGISEDHMSTDFHDMDKDAR